MLGGIFHASSSIPMAKDIDNANMKFKVLKSRKKNQVLQLAS